MPRPRKNSTSGPQGVAKPPSVPPSSWIMTVIPTEVFSRLGDYVSLLTLSILRFLHSTSIPARISLSSLSFSFAIFGTGA